MINGLENKVILMVATKYGVLTSLFHYRCDFSKRIVATSGIDFHAYRIKCMKI